MRQSNEYILAKRKEKKNLIFLTGSTSFVGVHIARKLLERGHSIIFLCRPKDEMSVYQRMYQYLTWADVNSFERIKIFDGHIDEPRLGLSDEDYEFLVQNVDEIIHCLSDTSFKKDNNEIIERINVQGTINLLKLAEESRCYFFHYISTSYSVGKKQGTCMEEYQPQTQFHNKYEETKHIAEGLVLEICKRAGIRSNIYRPSIIFGDSKTGKTLKFNAVYYPSKIINFLKDRFENDIKENKGVIASQMGVRKLDNGKMYMPIRVEKSVPSVINVVTIDYVVNAYMAIMDNCLEGDIFHIVAGDNTISIDKIVEYVNRYFNIQGIESMPVKEIDENNRTPLEKLLDSYIEIYKPFFHDTRTFDDTNTKKYLKKYNITRSFVEYENFAKCLDYASEVNWGKSLFDKIEIPDNFIETFSDSCPNVAAN